MPKSKECPGYSQSSLQGLKTETRPEIMLEWVIVESLPTYRKNGKGYAWEGVVSCPPDIFHQGRNETYTRGEKRMINYFTASAIDVVKRAKRESISVYEKDRNTG